MTEMSNARTVYIAGKITGDPNYKAKFDRAAEVLTGLGYIVLSPAILPPTGFEYEAYMRMSKAMLQECEIVCVLPDWIESVGAQQEFDYARRGRLEIIDYDKLVEQGAL